MTDTAFTQAAPRGFKEFFKPRGERMHWTDYVTYGYLIIGVLVMLLPVLWVVIGSLKSPANLSEYPPTLMPMATQTIVVDGHPDPLPLFEVTQDDGTVKTLAQIRRVGIRAQMIDPDDPAAEPSVVDVAKAKPIRSFNPTFDNYKDLLRTAGDTIWRSIYNSAFITIVATLITLVINSMAAFALSKFRFTGSTFALVLILATLMVPATIILVPIYLINSQLGLVNSLWGVILPVLATPTGVFLLRQYMLTIPDELLEAARMDHASEWQIYWRIVLPLTTPALAVVAIFSIMSRWNDFLLPLIVLNTKDSQTLQLALAGFKTEQGIEWHLLLAMTTITALPLAFIFLFLQRYITTGIASSGVK
ncbi:carbohydrate ABC transporter permease [Paracoccus sp. S3-43]|uniref:carbohydrate ABC transporter permease n=1 Tax=Paracoccus sp. S3-43 TaxID=3030011 RepID=UPI0023B0EC4C|nr:carbohydrate ABC transporter permease [Paracoccus sp. S3-43]WEF25158.1 carbohydrate ABC transporter permease [Paracoccus sp. S3-43]